MEFNIIVYILGLVLAAFLIYGEVKRPDKARLIWRIIAEIIAVISLVFIIVPPKYISKHYNAHELVLQSNGGPVDSLFVLETGKKPVAIADLAYYLKNNKDINSIRIKGLGLSASDLQTITKYPVSFDAADTPTGFIHATWNHHMQFGESIIVQGKFFKKESGSAKIILRGFGANLDSVVIKAGGSTNFTLKNLPLQSGKAIFMLIAISGKDTISAEPVPFEVAESLPLRIVVLASSPDFEYRFLKSWLFTQKHSVTMRSKISKDKFSLDFFNTESKTFALGKSSLDAADLVIADEEELDALSAGEQSALNTAISNGLGLLVRIYRNDKLPKSRLISGLSRYETTDSLQKQLLVNLPAGGFIFAPLLTAQNLFIKSGSYNQSILKDKSQRILAESYLNGMGKVTGTTLTATYPWMLSSQTSSYNKYWSELISKTARPAAALSSISVNPLFPRVGNTIRIMIERNNGLQPLVSIEGKKPAIRQNIQFPFQWDLSYWSQKVGWNTIIIDQKSYAFYVYDNSSWLNAEHYQSIKRTDAFLRTKVDGKKPVHDELPQEKSVSVWLFFLIFAISAGFLWSEPRIFS